MQLLVQENSILNKIPVVLNPRQVFVPEGIRFSANSISLCFNNLSTELINISIESTNGVPSIESFYSIISNAWNMIDWTNRLTTLISSFSPTDETKPIGENFAYLLRTKEFRNTLQHIEERIDEQIISLNVPVWGFITWTKCIDENLFRLFTLMAGHARETRYMPISNPLGNPIASSIDHITLHSIVKRPTYHMEQISLSELYQRTQNVINKLEKDMELQLSQHMHHGTFSQDFFVSVDLALDKK